MLRKRTVTRPDEILKIKANRFGREIANRCVIIYNDSFIWAWNEKVIYSSRKNAIKGLARALRCGIFDWNTETFIEFPNEMTNKPNLIEGIIESYIAEGKIKICTLKELSEGKIKIRI